LRAPLDLAQIVMDHCGQLLGGLHLFGWIGRGRMLRCRFGHPLSLALGGTMLLEIIMR
jgi:hypothetical protein